MEYEERLAQAENAYAQGQDRVHNTPVPEGQKYPPGTCVRIAKNLGRAMAHFPCDCDAVVLYTYAHAYGGKDVTSYCLSIKGNEHSWYEEWQLTPLDGWPVSGVPYLVDSI